MAYPRVEPGFKVPLRIFAEDFLRCGVGLEDQNSPISLLDQRINLIVGNPPWGGVLKGWQGPLYDATERAQLRQSFGALWKDKVDVYALFLNNVIDFLPQGGRLSFLIQSSLLDKDFGRPLRNKIASQTTPTVIIDLSGQGGSYFSTASGGIQPTTSRKKVMNVPMALVLKKSVETEGNIRIITTRFSLTQREERAGELIKLTEVLKAELTKTESGEYTFGRRVKLSSFNLDTPAWRNWRGNVWRLDPSLSMRNIFAVMGCEPLLAITTTQRGTTALGDDHFARAAQYLHDHAYSGPGFYGAMRGDDIRRGVQQNSSEVAVYPYRRKGERIFESGQLDLLDPQPAEAEADLLGENRNLTRLVELRIAQGSILSNVAVLANALVTIFEPLSARRPKGKPMSAFGREWYEWLWKRKPAMMLSSPKIVAQRITTRPVAGIDNDGFMPYDTVIVIIPKEPRFSEWLQEWSQVLQRPLETIDGMAIIASWLNSAPVRGLHIIGRIPTPAGCREFTEDLAKEITLPRADQAENLVLRQFIEWSVEWRNRPAESCFDPLGTDIDNRLREVGGWREPQYG